MFIKTTELNNSELIRQLKRAAHIVGNAFPEDVSPLPRKHVENDLNTWAHQSKENLDKLIMHLFDLGFEYTERFGEEHPIFYTMHTFLRTNIKALSD